MIGRASLILAALALVAACRVTEPDGAKMRCLKGSLISAAFPSTTVEFWIKEVAK